MEAVSSRASRSQRTKVRKKSSRVSTSESLISQGSRRPHSSQEVKEPEQFCAGLNSGLRPALCSLVFGAVEAATLKGLKSVFPFLFITNKYTNPMNLKDIMD